MTETGREEKWVRSRDRIVPLLAVKLFISHSDFSNIIQQLPAGQRTARNGQLRLFSAFYHRSSLNIDMQIARRASHSRRAIWTNLRDNHGLDRSTSRNLLQRLWLRPVTTARITATEEKSFHSLRSKR
jgi:hypothetical protein